MLRVIVAVTRGGCGLTSSIVPARGLCFGRLVSRAARKPWFLPPLCRGRLVRACSVGSTTQCDLARQLQAKIGRARDQLLIFCDYPGKVDVTNNTSERKLRPCVIQRKVTNGYRAMWAAGAEADVRTAVDTARLKGANPFAVIVGILA